MLRLTGVLRAEHLVAWPKNIEMMSVLKSFPFPDGSVEAIYSSHMLEHLYFSDAQAVLRECHRVLQPGGVLRLALPNGLQIAAALVAANGDGSAEAGLRFNQGLMMAPLTPPSRRQKVLSMLASGPHRWQPTPALVSQMLKDAGFNAVEECAFRSGKLPALADVETREESFFLEAVRRPTRVSGATVDDD